jgi:hypothetical protein
LSDRDLVSDPGQHQRDVRVHAGGACNAKSMPELMELSNKEMMTEQAKEITDAVQKAAVESTRPLTGFANTFGRIS